MSSPLFPFAQQRPRLLAQGLEQLFPQLQHLLPLLQGQMAVGPLFQGQHRVGHPLEQLLAPLRHLDALAAAAAGQIFQGEIPLLLQLFQGGIHRLLAEKQLSAQLALADLPFCLPQCVQNGKGAVRQTKVPSQAVVNTVILLV